MDDMMKKKLEDMIKSLESIKEDLTYGASLDKLPTHNFIKASVELDMIATRLHQISNKLCDQTKITE
jgi:ribosomal protein L30E